MLFVTITSLVGCGGEFVPLSTGGCESSVLNAYPIQPSEFTPLQIVSHEGSQNLDAEFWTFNVQDFEEEFEAPADSLRIEGGPMNCRNGECRETPTRQVWCAQDTEEPFRFEIQATLLGSSIAIQGEETSEEHLGCEFTFDILDRETGRNLGDGTFKTQKCAEAHERWLEANTDD